MIVLIFQRIDINKTNASKKCDICHYWCFLHKNFKYEPHLCTGCRNLMEKAINFDDVAIVSVKGSYYSIHFWYISKGDAINEMKNPEIKKSGLL